jgi:hypothetical protein
VVTYHTTNAGGSGGSAPPVPLHENPLYSPKSVLEAQAVEGQQGATPPLTPGGPSLAVISRERLKVLHEIGCGFFGKVCLAELTPDDASPGTVEYVAVSRTPSSKLRISSCMTQRKHGS